jgi:hypothetical protein
MPQQACISLPTNADLMDVDPGPHSAIQSEHEHDITSASPMQSKMVSTLYSRSTTPAHSIL